MRASYDNAYSLPYLPSQQVIRVSGLLLLTYLERTKVGLSLNFCRSQRLFYLTSHQEECFQLHITSPLCPSTACPPFRVQRWRSAITQHFSYSLLSHSCPISSRGQTRCTTEARRGEEGRERAGLPEVIPS